MGYPQDFEPSTDHSEQNHLLVMGLKNSVHEPCSLTMRR